MPLRYILVNFLQNPVFLVGRICEIFDVMTIVLLTFPIIKVKLPRVGELFQNARLYSIYVIYNKVSY